MSKPTDLLTALTQLRSLIQSGNPPMDHKGICTWLNHNALIPTHAFVDLCHKWPKCIEITDRYGNTFKCTALPILNHQEYTEAYNTNTQWSNPTRLEFIDWAIERLTQEQSK